MQSLTEGAMLAGLTVILVLLMTYIPVAGAVAALMVSTPTTVLVVRHGLRTAAISSVVAGLLLFPFVGPISAILGWIQITGIGLPLGYGFRTQRPAWQTLLVTTIAFVVVAGLGFTAAVWISGFNPLELMLTTYRESGAVAFNLYERTGLLPAEISDRSEFEAWWNATIDTTARLLPVGFAAGFGGYALLTHGLNRAVLSRLGYRVPAVTPFARWQLPLWALYALAGVLLASQALLYIGVAIPEAALQNVTVGAMIILGVNGMATAYAFLQSWGLGRGATIAVLGAALLFQLTLPLTWLGMFDAGLRLRRRYIPELFQEEGEDRS